MKALALNCTLKTATQNLLAVAEALAGHPMPAPAGWVESRSAS